MNFQQQVRSALDVLLEHDRETHRKIEALYQLLETSAPEPKTRKPYRYRKGSISPQKKYWDSLSKAEQKRRSKLMIAARKKKAAARWAAARREAA